MVCEEVIRELSSYIDGDLDSGVRQALELHLEHCDDCRIVMNTARKTLELYCGKDPVPLPADVQQEIDRALAEKLSKKP